MGLPTIGSRWSGNLDFMNDAQLLARRREARRRRQTSARATRRSTAATAGSTPTVDALAAAMREVAPAAGRPSRRAPRGARRADRALRARADRPPDRRARRRPRSTRWRQRGSRLACVRLARRLRLRPLARRRQRRLVERARGGGARPCQRLVPESIAAPHRRGRGRRALAAALRRAERSGPFVLYQPWEFGRVPQRWVEEIRTSVDEVWAPSEPPAEAFVASGVAAGARPRRPERRRPRALRPGAGRPGRSPSRRPTVFLFVGGTIYRKGIDLLLDAYGRPSRPTTTSASCSRTSASRHPTAARRPTTQIARVRGRADVARARATSTTTCRSTGCPALYRAADVARAAVPRRGLLPAGARGDGLRRAGDRDRRRRDRRLRRRPSARWRIPSRRVPSTGGRASDRAMSSRRAGSCSSPTIEALVAALRGAADPVERSARAAHARAHAERFGWERAGRRRRRARIEALRDRRPIRSTRPPRCPTGAVSSSTSRPTGAEPETWAPAAASLPRGVRGGRRRHARPADARRGRPRARER